MSGSAIKYPGSNSQYDVVSAQAGQDNSTVSLPIYDCILPADAGVAIEVDLVDLVARAAHFERSFTTIHSGKGRLLGVYVWIESGGDVWYSTI